MAWGSGDEMQSLSGQYDLTNPTRENLNYRYSSNPRVACRFCEHFTMPSDCDLLGNVRAVDVCDAFAPDAHPEPVDLDALDFSEGDNEMNMSDRPGIAGSKPIAMTPSTMSPALLSAFVDRSLRTLREWKEQCVPRSKPYMAIEEAEHAFTDLQRQYCPTPAQEAWQRLYERPAPSGSSPSAERAIRSFQESYEPRQRAAPGTEASVHRALQYFRHHYKG